MASGGGEEKKFGRTAWDMLDAALKSKPALAAIILLIVAAIALAATGRMKINFGREGWVFCLPCDQSASTPAVTPSQSASATVPAASPKAAKLLFQGILKVPLHSSRQEAEILAPDLQTSSTKGIIFNQQFLGVDGIKISENFEENDPLKRTESFAFSRSVNVVATLGNGDYRSGDIKDVRDSCFGPKYTAFVARLSDSFGPATVISEKKQNIAAETSPGFTPSGSVQICVEANRRCQKEARRRSRVTSFASYAGTLEFTVKFTTILRDFGRPTNSDWIEQYEYICDWSGIFTPPTAR
jgi:hypothetical protein